MFKIRLVLLFIIIFSILLASCAAGSDNTAAAAAAVQSYWQAMVERDLNKVVTSSCAAWEAQARTEFNSFSAVTLKLDNVKCQAAGQASPAAGQAAGDAVQVTCSGAIIANYGAEDLTIDIADRTYRVVNEGGEWRMCGYQ